MGEPSGSTGGHEEAQTVTGGAGCSWVLACPGHVGFEQVVSHPSTHTDSTTTTTTLLLGNGWQRQTKRTKQKKAKHKKNKKKKNMLTSIGDLLKTVCLQYGVFQCLCVSAASTNLWVCSVARFCVLSVPPDMLDSLTWSVQFNEFRTHGRKPITPKWAGAL